MRTFGLFLCATATATTMACGGSSPTAPNGPLVMAIKSLDGIAFINETDAALSNCTATIDGDHYAAFNELKPKARVEIARQQFSGGNQRDEFFTRARRKLSLRCLTAEDKTVSVRLK